MKLLLALITSLALVTAVQAEQENHKKKKGEAPAQTVQPKQNVQPKQLNKTNKHQANQLQQQQHLQNKQVKHLKNQDQHDQHLENKMVKHEKNQDQHQEHLENKQAKHLANQQHKIQKFETSKGWKKGVESEKFEQGKHIKGSENWKGDKYVVFQNYHSEWHDHDWWHHHHDNIILISGGYYFWNAGFWFPAWGYDPAYTYYPYDGPIYTGQATLPPDQIIANVQAALHEEGYYEGEVDGLLGPLTRAALASYQADHGLYLTSAIDEPTLQALGMA